MLPVFSVPNAAHLQQLQLLNAELKCLTAANDKILDETTKKYFPSDRADTTHPHYQTVVGFMGPLYLLKQTIEEAKTKRNYDLPACDTFMKITELLTPFEHLHGVDKAFWNEFKVTRKKADQLSYYSFAYKVILSFGTPYEMVEREPLIVKYAPFFNKVYSIYWKTKLKDLETSGADIPPPFDPNATTLKFTGMSRDMRPYLGRCHNLTHLTINENQFGVYKIKTVYLIALACPNLQSLDLSRGNRIGKNGAIVLSMALPNLTELNLATNRIGPEGTSAIASRLTKLITLNLESNEVGIAAYDLAQMTNLTSLNLGFNDIYASPMAEIGKLTKLKTLHVNDNSNAFMNRSHSTTAMEGISNLIGLTYLQLENNSIVDAEVPYLLKLTNLTELRMYMNNLTVQGITPLLDLPHLDKLDVSFNDADDALVEELKNQISARLS